MFERILPKDPGKRDLVILALLVIPLMAAGVIWGILGDFDTGSPPAEPVPTPTPMPEATPSGTPVGFMIVENV